MSNLKSKDKLIIGLTGGIACGKSSIALLFKSQGVTVIDADEVARQVVEVGSPLLDTLKQRFGSQIIQEDGTLNRPLLRKIVFDSKDSKNLEDLNSIMQPAIRQELIAQIQRVNAPYVIAMIPLLLEHKLEFMVDRVLVIDVDEKTQLNRLTKRDNIDENLAKLMIQKQVSRDYRLKKADDLIESDDSPLDKKLNVVLKLHQKYLELAKTKLQ